MLGPVPLPYYRRLSRRQQAIYRQSAAVSGVSLPQPEALTPHVEQIRAALDNANRAQVQRHAQRLVEGVSSQLSVAGVKVRVLAKRPASAEGELHGLYILEEGETPIIKVWMKTAANAKVVAFRTFLRTLIHEVCHHLDYHLLELEDSFHTEGFFRRESSVMRQLVASKQTRASVPGVAATTRARSNRPRGERSRGASSGAPRARTRGTPKPRSPRTADNKPARSRPEQIPLRFGAAGKES